MVLNKLSILACSGLLVFGCADVKQAGRDIGHGTRDATRAIGHGTRDAVKAIGHGTRDIVKEVGHGTRDAAKSLKEEVSGSGDSTHNGPRSK